MCNGASQLCGFFVLIGGIGPSYPFIWKDTYSAAAQAVNPSHVHPLNRGAEDRGKCPGVIIDPSSLANVKF